MNKVFQIGNLTRDPESAQTKNGVTVTKFTIAVNRNFANADGERVADYFTVVAWRNLAENCAKYLSKGKKVAVVGSLQNRSYEDSNGNKKTVTEIMADEIEFLSSIGEGRGEQQEEKPKRKLSDLQPIDDEDMPF